jgi:hypothetical protein
MSHTETPVGRDGLRGRRNDAPDDRGEAPEPTNGAQRTYRPQWPSLIWASIVCLFAALMLAGGAWVLWMDRIDRDAAGFVQIDSGKLHTDTYAIVSDLRGAGPDWLYGSTIFGNTRARVTSDTTKPVFVGIARTSDVKKYLGGTGYATIDHLASGTVTPHAGSAPSAPPATTTIWAATKEGTGEQTIVWKPRAGDWRIVIMNADGSAGVAAHGDVSAKFPAAPWVALGFLVAGALLALLGSWMLVRAIHRGRVVTLE